MNWVVMVISLAGAAYLQLVLPAYLFFGQAKFPFLLAVVLYYALNRETGIAMMAGLFAGVLQDSLSMIPLGFSSLSFCLVAWFVSRFRSVIMLESAFTPVLFGAVAAPAALLCLYVLLGSRDLMVCGPGWCALKLSGGAALGAAVTPAVFCFVRRFDMWVGNVEGLEVR